MAKIAGLNGRFYVSSDGGSNYTLFGSATDVSLSGSQDTYDTTTKDSSLYKEAIAGRKSATLDVSCFWDEADAGQDIVRTAFFAGTNVYVKFYLRTASGAVQYISDSIITSYAPSSPNDDVSTMDISFQLTGSFAESTQS